MNFLPKIGPHYSAVDTLLCATDYKACPRNHKHPQTSMVGLMCLPDDTLRLVFHGRVMLGRMTCKRAQLVLRLSGKDHPFRISLFGGVLAVWITRFPHAKLYLFCKKTYDSALEIPSCKGRVFLLLNHSDITSLSATKTHAMRLGASAEDRKAYWVAVVQTITTLMKRPTLVRPVTVDNFTTIIRGRERIGESGGTDVSKVFERFSKWFATGAETMPRAKVFAFLSLWGAIASKIESGGSTLGEVYLRIIRKDHREAGDSDDLRKVHDHIKLLAYASCVNATCCINNTHNFPNGFIKSFICLLRDRVVLDVNESPCELTQRVIMQVGSMFKSPSTRDATVSAGMVGAFITMIDKSPTPEYVTSALKALDVAATQDPIRPHHNNLIGNGNGNSNSRLIPWALGFAKREGTSAVDRTACFSLIGKLARQVAHSLSDNNARYLFKGILKLVEPCIRNHNDNHTTTIDCARLLSQLVMLAREDGRERECKLLLSVGWDKIMSDLESEMKSIFRVGVPRVYILCDLRSLALALKPHTAKGVGI